MPFLTGLYVSSISGCMGALYGSPRILQSIANDNVIPVIKILGHGVSNITILYIGHRKVVKNTKILYHGLSE